MFRDSKKSSRLEEKITQCSAKRSLLTLIGAAMSSQDRSGTRHARSGRGVLVSTDARNGLSPWTAVNLCSTSFLFLFKYEEIIWELASVDGLSPDGQRILAAERDRFNSALLSYCMATHGVANAPAHYAAVLSMVDILHRQAKTQKDFHVIIQMQRSRFHVRGAYREGFIL
ncbi:unnamed protein product [Haemonchus placei]|uniref:E3 ubiquitin-protein ligase n=1 Tax=Haemonchus placei TaxID=6290 RepID=A0A0N4WNL2_HAEPC|nr:unnamed protein product [Haemonchus placei]